jgi:hypothetical protein
MSRASAVDVPPDTRDEPTVAYLARPDRSSAFQDRDWRPDFQDSYRRSDVQDLDLRFDSSDSPRRYDFLDRNRRSDQLDSKRTSRTSTQRSNAPTDSARPAPTDLSLEQIRQLQRQLQAQVDKQSRSSQISPSNRATAFLAASESATSGYTYHARIDSEDDNSGEYHSPP